VTIKTPFSSATISAKYTANAAAGNKTVVKSVKLRPRGSHTFPEMKDSSGALMPITNISGRMVKRKFSFPVAPFATGANNNLRFRIYIKCPKVVWKLEAVDGKNVK
jgi:hypothetical protein